MAVCINRNLREYQTLKEMSGIPEIILDFYCSKYLEKFDRLPELDELPNVNSEEYLKDSIKIQSIGDIDFADNDAIRENIGVSPEEASVKINSIHKDLEVKVIPTSDKKSMIEIRHRPSEFVDGTDSWYYDKNFGLLTSISGKKSDGVAFANDFDHFIFSNKVKIITKMMRVNDCLNKTWYSNIKLGNHTFYNSKEYTKMISDHYPIIIEFEID